MFVSRFGRYEWLSGWISCCAIMLTRFDDERPMITSNPTAPDAILANASEAELYVAISTLRSVSFSNALTAAGSM